MSLKVGRRDQEKGMEVRWRPWVEGATPESRGGTGMVRPWEQREGQGLCTHTFGVVDETAFVLENRKTHKKRKNPE